MRATLRRHTSASLRDRHVRLSSSTIKANREHRDQARQESESFHKLHLVCRLNIITASLLQGFG
jgi:hypothetical protein